MFPIKPCSVRWSHRLSAQNNSFLGSIGTGPAVCFLQTCTVPFRTANREMLAAGNTCPFQDSRAGLSGRNNRRFLFVLLQNLGKLSLGDGPCFPRGSSPCVALACVSLSFSFGHLLKQWLSHQGSASSVCDTAT